MRSTRHNKRVNLTRRGTLVPVVAALLLVSAVLAGCGGGGSTAASDAASASPPAARPGAYVYAIGFPDLIVRSSDGGHTWRVVHRDLATASPDLPMLMACAFAGADRGWAVGRSGTVLATSDAGVSWAAQRTPSSGAILDAVTAVDADHVWAVGREPQSGSGPSRDGAVLWATVDGGAPWQAQRLAGVSNLRGVAFADARHGWVVGGDMDGEYGVVLGTSDGGARWREQVRYHLTYFSGVTCTDAEHAWAVGGPQQYPINPGETPPPLIAATSDGHTWTTQLASDASTDAPLRGLSFTDSTTGWAVGSETLLSTADGGSTWATHAVEKSWRPMSSVSFADAQHGWVLGGDKRSLLMTQDGGATWSRSGPIAEPPTLFSLLAFGPAE
jgi:photosystem II stability/assembly factor-like uncharacterized protein